MQPTDPTLFTDLAWNAIVASQEVARSFKQQQLEVEHLMIALLEQEPEPGTGDDNWAEIYLQQANVDVQSLYNQLEDYARRQPRSVSGNQLYLGRDLDRLLDQAENARQIWQDELISVEHVLMGFVEDDRLGRRVSKLYALDARTMEAGVMDIRRSEQSRLATAPSPKSGVMAAAGPTPRTPNPAPPGGSNGAGNTVPGANAPSKNGTIMTSEGDVLVGPDGQPQEPGKSFSRQSPLEKYGRDLTQLAEEGKIDPVIGRDEEIRRVIQVLSRRTKNNPVLIGEPGVGKTAIAEALAQRINNGDVPESLKGRQLISLDMGLLIAGAKYRGEFEDRLRSVLKQVMDSDGQIVLFIDELHTVVGGGSGQGGAMDAGNLLKPLLGRGELRCIGATTTDEYRKNIEKDPALERRFQQIVVQQPTVEDTVSILRGLKERYEMHHGVQITDSALLAAASLSDRYISDRFLPDKAIDLVDEAAAQLRMEVTSKPQELENVERRLDQLKMEKLSLEGDEDRAGLGGLHLAADAERVERLAKEIEDLDARRAPLLDQWQKEKQLLDDLKEIKRQEDDMRRLVSQAQRDEDLETASKLQYSELAALQRKHEELEQQLLDMQANGTMLLREQVTDGDIAEIVARWTGIPVNRLMASEREKLLQLESYLHKRVVGQDEAAVAVASAIRMARAGMNDPGKPLGSFLFMGPTGVGKTELARALAEALFDTDEAIVRLDMSEYMDKSSVMRVLGAPPGYVGYEEGGQLTEMIRRKPYSVLLLDEVEKAHPDVFNILLQVLDDGRITDSQGRATDFRNTIIVMTSNIGSKIILEAGGDAEKDEATHDNVMSALRKHFRPEFLNRIDETIIFTPLSKSELEQIVGIQMRRLERLLGDQNLKIELTPAAKAHIAEVGYDPVYGARPLKRAIRRLLENPIATKLLENTFGEGDTIQVDVDDTGLSFAKQAQEAEEVPAIAPASEVA